MMPERLHSLDDEALDKLAHLVASALQGRIEGGVNWDRVVTYILASLTVVSLIFTFGVNYSRISSNERRLDIVEHRLDTADTAMSNIRREMTNGILRIEKELGDIKAQLGEIRGSLKR